MDDYLLGMCVLHKSVRKRRGGGVASGDTKGAAADAGGGSEEAEGRSRDIFFGEEAD